MKGLIRLISKLWLIGLPFVFLWGVYYVFFAEVTKEVAIFLTIYFIIGGWLFGDRAPYKDTMDNYVYSFYNDTTYRVETDNNRTFFEEEESKPDILSPTLDNVIYPDNIYHIYYHNNH